MTLKNGTVRQIEESFLKIVSFCLKEIFKFEPKSYLCTKCSIKGKKVSLSSQFLFFLFFLIFFFVWRKTIQYISLDKVLHLFFVFFFSSIYPYLSSDTKILIHTLMFLPKKKKTKHSFIFDLFSEVHCLSSTEIWMVT